MKKTVMFLIALFILISGCKKEEEIEYTDIKGEIIYTDSFSPIEWESPVSRKNIDFGDMDIGLIIAEDVLEPRQRTLLTTIRSFIASIQKGEISEVKSILTPASYNSFSLRYADLHFGEEYELRVGLPKQIENQTYWVDFKLLFTTKSLMGKVEVTWKGKDCRISDFEDDFFAGVMEDQSEQ